ncbi:MULTISPECIES: Gfo/Idh/MocA family protein [unclassified Frondihabitans]|uniref:Gfo/Idh/MocA family protein n=1 Tax=unclassified Frondihabitans TaxID=2626248 RepID=UPI000F4FD8E5|nr:MULTISPECIES: Gfo/Idh/MocA family oxidoreductase [unclassified Frondihabitans]RPE78498.1 putative dehydrogenase [Frondihabitans sp. PhB153]RPF08779.1 putative dehydrogenase [Frondihabitans sp. PhB161]
MTTTLGVGLISVGWMGRLHSRAYRALPDHFPELDVVPRFVVAADPVAEARGEAVSRLGFERAVADYHEVLADPEVDVVSICSPNFLHREMAVAAAKAGKPFWIEKPMGRYASDSRQIAKAVAAAGVVTAVGFNYRHAPAVEHMRSLVRDGRIGRVTNVRGTLLADYSSNPLAPLTWRFERERAGSGVLGDLLSHGLDLAQYVAGRISSVTALAETFITDRPAPGAGVVDRSAAGTGALKAVENEDYAALLFRFDSGAVGTMDSSRIMRGPRAEYALEVYGTTGSIRWDFQRLNELEVCLDDAPEYGYTTIYLSPGQGEFGRFQPGGGTGMGFDDLKTIEAAQFVKSVLTGEQLAPSVADGLATATIVEAAEASLADGAWHDVPRVDGPLTYDAPAPVLG